MCTSALALATQRGIIVLRRLPESGPWFAPRGLTPDNALFRRDSFAACDRRDVELSFVPPTPCASWLGEPNRSLRVLTLSVARWCSPRPSVPRSARPSTPKGHWAECHRARVFRARSLIGTAGLPTQSAFSWLDLALRPGESRSLHRSKERYAPRTPPSPPLGDPPCHGDGSPPTAISSLPPALPPLVHPNKMPLTNLCSRLLLSRAPVEVPTPKPATHAAWPVAPCSAPLPTPEREQRNRTVLDDVG
jgi:hypothetical protein